MNRRLSFRFVRGTWIGALALALSVAAACGKKSEPTQAGGGGGGATTEPFDSGIFSSSSAVKVYVHTFNTPGDYPYHCRVHGSAMTGNVHVAAALPDSPVVTISNNSYGPPSVSVKTGGYVKWVATGGNHSATRP